MPRHTPPTCILILLLASHATAEGHPPAVPAPPPVCEKSLTQRQILLVPREEAITLPKLTLREVEVGRLPGLALDFLEQKQTVTELQLKECEVEQQVVCIEMKEVKTTDPCTGKCHTDYVPCEVLRTVKVKVYTPVPVCRDVVV